MKSKAYERHDDERKGKGRAKTIMVWGYDEYSKSNGVGSDGAE